MTKRKPTATILVADGEGGMREVAELRFDSGDWAIELAISADSAVAWMAQLHAEIEERGWSASGIWQLDPGENSGSLAVHTATGQSPPTLEVIWERQRGGDLRIRARVGGDPELPLDAATEFLDAVEKRQREGRTTRVHRRDMLTYVGMPWRGELWLGNDTRLGPPSRFPEPLLGPQIVIVDAVCEGVGQQGVSEAFATLVHQVRVFLGFVLASELTPARLSNEWVYQAATDSHEADISVRPVGYVEMSPAADMPLPGSDRPVERRAVARPGLGPVGIWPDMVEEWVPDDIETLWDIFRRISPQKRDQLMRAGNAYQIARSMWPAQRTACATFLVIACESLKPTGRRHERKNIYDVVEELLGKGHATRLRGMSPRPQTVRSRHVHAGELAAGELLPMMMTDYFADPSLGTMIDELFLTTRTCLIEWLRREGR